MILLGKPRSELGGVFVEHSVQGVVEADVGDDGREEARFGFIDKVPVSPSTGEFVEHRVRQPHQIPNGVAPVDVVGDADGATLERLDDVGVAGEGRVEAGVHCLGSLVYVHEFWMAFKYGNDLVVHH